MLASNVCRALPLLLLVAQVVLVAPAGAQSGSARYDATIESAVAEFSAGRWAEARALFKRAHTISPNARTLRGMGMAAYELRLYVPALRELEGSLRETRKALSAAQRKQVGKLIDQASAFVGRYTLVLQPATASVSVDGASQELEPGNVVLLELGDHALTASAPGHADASHRLRVEGGENQQVELTLESAAPAAGAAAATTGAAAAAEAPAQGEAEQDYAEGGSGGRASLMPFAWTAVGGAAVFGAAAAGFWVLGDSKYSELEVSCGQTNSCTDADIDASGVKTADTLTTVFLGLSIASAVTGAILIMIDVGRGAADQDEAVAVDVGPTGVQLRGSF